MIFFLTRIAIFIAVLYLIYFFYKSLQQPTGKKVSKITTITACPSPKIFMDYTEGRMKGKKKKVIDDHIAHCKNCQDALKDVFDMPKNEESKSKGTV
ncbi:MAG: hypothetical protein P9L90_06260 [Candidatus Aadella gelida]|nr:hypothetical protein [Candidatus Aadella gelida]